MNVKQKLEISPCSCGGLIKWKKEDVRVGKDIFKRLEAGVCDTCKIKYLTDDSADLILEKHRAHKNK